MGSEVEKSAVSHMGVFAFHSVIPEGNLLFAFAALLP